MNAHDERIVALATALAPHQAKYDQLDHAYRVRQVLAEELRKIDETIRLLTVDLYDGMTVQVIQAEIGK